MDYMSLIVDIEMLFTKSRSHLQRKQRYIIELWHFAAISLYI